MKYLKVLYVAAICPGCARSPSRAVAGTYTAAKIPSGGTLGGIRKDLEIL
jgi:hypothetical protein